jgi:hypothetical protein
MSASAFPRSAYGACASLALGVLGATSPAAVASTIYSFTYGGEGSGTTMAPVAFDADSLEVLRGGFLGASLGEPSDMAVDETGRLFGFNGLTRQLAEFDPVTLAVLDSTPITTGALHGLAAHQGTLYSFTYGDGVLTPVSFNANSLDLENGSLLGGTLGAPVCMAVDESGRLFGYNPLTHRLMELDPDTLVTLHSAAIIGNLHGLAAHGGSIYSYTYGDTGIAPIALDADSLTLRQGSFLVGSLGDPADIAVDAKTGRLFGSNPLRDQLTELDPVTLTVLNSTPIQGGLHGLAVFSVPEPSLLGTLSLAATLALRRRRMVTSGSHAGRIRLPTK